MAGAVLVASRSQGVRRAGFAAWVVGNLLWVVYASLQENAYMMFLSGFYWLTAALGLMNAREKGGTRIDLLRNLDEIRSSSPWY